VSIRPPRLEYGDRVAIISPAGPVNPPEIQPSIDVLEEEGYEVVRAPHIFSKHGYLSGTDVARLEDLHAVFNDKSIKAVLCSRGGYGSLRLLEKIDYELIRKNPKIILGYSDITALLLAIYKETGMVTFHSPVAKDLYKNNKRNLGPLINCVTDQANMEIDLSEGEVLIRGMASGPVVGGNLSLITHMMGTPFFPATEGSILFIEEKGESPYRIDRMLTHLRLGGVIEHIAGMIFGSFVECGDLEELKRIFREFIADLSIPLLSGFPVGHGTENITIPIGLDAEFDTINMKLTFIESCVV
jgi:muramoyltetrapeptide carboxypeptidase